MLSVLKRVMVIQDVRELVNILTTAMGNITEHYQLAGHVMEDFIKWIIVEELENIHGLFDPSHQRNHLPYSHVHNVIATTLPAPGLSAFVNHYCRVPRIYGDNNQISVQLNELDLVIIYHGLIPHPLTSQLHERISY
jgi:hypothetical protein